MHFWFVESQVFDAESNKDSLQVANQLIHLRMKGIVKKKFLCFGEVFRLKLRSSQDNFNQFDQIYRVLNLRIEMNENYK